MRYGIEPVLPDSGVPKPPFTVADPSPPFTWESGALLQAYLLVLSNGRALLYSTACPQTQGPPASAYVGIKDVSYHAQPLPPFEYNGSSGD